MTACRQKRTIEPRLPCELQAEDVPMKVPGGDAAIVDAAEAQLTPYCLNPEHRRGEHKAGVFTTLGFSAENADELRGALLTAAVTFDAVLVG